MKHWLEVEDSGDLVLAKLFHDRKETQGQESSLISWYAWLFSCTRSFISLQPQDNGDEFIVRVFMYNLHILVPRTKFIYLIEITESIKNGKRINDIKLQWYMHIHIYSSTTHNNQNFKPAYMSINRWMNKEM